MGKGLAALIARCYPKPPELRKMSLSQFPLGSIVIYFDPNNNRFIYNLLTKCVYFYKLTYETLELSLQALRQHIGRHNIREIAIPKFGCGYHWLHWPKVRPFLPKVFFVLKPNINDFSA